MSLSMGNVTFDCADSMAVGAFWAAALERPLDDGSSADFASIPANNGQPGWFFIKVPEGKSGKNRVHLDLEAEDREAEVERLVGLGATRHADHDHDGARWTVLSDVEGNEFCVV